MLKCEKMRALELVTMIVRGSKILPQLWWFSVDAEGSTAREPGPGHCTYEGNSSRKDGHNQDTETVWTQERQRDQAEVARIHRTVQKRSQ